MRAYYATKLSPNISRMPNGFLICKNVPIARTGSQDYQGSELGIIENPDDIFAVHREESEVFNPSALASFEGVSFVDEHPLDDVTVDNACYLTKGFVKDVRRGNGDDSDKVIADIIVTDANIIAEIESGKREISCGYKCDYVTDENGKIYQCNIRGNHVALVDKGRAGKEVAIKDGKSITDIKSKNDLFDLSANRQENRQERRTMFMNKPKNGKQKNEKQGLLSKLFGVLTSDADPEIVAEIAEQLVESAEEEALEATAPNDIEENTDETKTNNANNTSDDTPPPWAVEIITRLGNLETKLETFESKKQSSDPLDELEKEINGESSENGEESVTKPVEEMGSEDNEDESSLDSEDEDETETKSEETGEEMGDDEDTADTETTDTKDTKTTKDAKIAIINAKKQVAKIKDLKTRRDVADAMAGLIRQTYGIKPSTPKGSYSAILSAKQKNAKRAKDAYQTFDNMEERQAAYDKRNPHLK